MQNVFMSSAEDLGRDYSTYSFLRNPKWSFCTNKLLSRSRPTDELLSSECHLVVTTGSAKDSQPATNTYHKLVPIWTQDCIDCFRDFIVVVVHVVFDSVGLRGGT